MVQIDSWAALADPTRRTILELIAREPRSVTEVARGLPVSRPAVSQHLKVLLAADLVEVEARGRERIYSAHLDGLTELRNEVDRFWHHALARFKDVAEQTYPSGGTT